MGDERDRFVESSDSNGVTLRVVNRHPGQGPYGAEIGIMENFRETARVRIGKDLFREWLKESCRVFGLGCPDRGSEAVGIIEDIVEMFDKNQTRVVSSPASLMSELGRYVDRAKKRVIEKGK